MTLADERLGRGITYFISFGIGMLAICALFRRAPEASVARTADAVNRRCFAGGLFGLFGPKNLSPRFQCIKYDKTAKKVYAKT